MSEPGTAAASPLRWPQLAAGAALILFLALAVAPLSAPFTGHDVNAHLARIAQWHRGVLEGVLYPRFVHDVHWGFGGPVMLFQPPLPYFLTEMPMLLGASPMLALQLGIALGLVGGAIAVYALVRPEWPAAASVAAAAYAIAPYRLLDAWVRAAYPELIATALVPLLLLAARKAAEEDKGRGWIQVALLAALLLLTHAPTSLFAIPMAVVYGAFRAVPARRPSATMKLLFGTALGFGLSAFFWVPATLERAATEFDRSVGPSSYFFYGHHFIDLRQLLESRWGFGESRPGAVDGMSFQLGRVHWLGVLGALGVAWRRPALRREICFWLTAALVAVYLTTASSQWIWRLLPLLHPVQFPWRFLLVPTLASSLFVGALVQSARTGPPWAEGVMVAVLLTATAVCYAPYAVARRAPPGLDAKFSPEGLQAWTGAHWVWLPKGAHPSEAPSPRVQAAAGAAAIQVVEDRTHRLSAQIHADAAVEVWARILWFPGWRAYVDGAEVPIATDPATGAIMVHMPPGDHDLRLRFGTTPARTAGMAISLTAVLVGALGMRGQRRGSVAASTVRAETDPLSRPAGS
jgi:6-pyruvoyl-tetrahydropterin synthase related domain